MEQQTASEKRRRIARHRSQKRKTLQRRPGIERLIAPQAVDLCLERLSSIGVRLDWRGIRELVWLLQRVLRTTFKGASLPLRCFSSQHLGVKLLVGLLEVGLIWCVDLYSWKPTNRDFRNAHARRFLPSSELFLANAGLETVSSAADYRSRKFGKRHIAQGSSVVLMPETTVRLSPYTVTILEKGTGLIFNLPKALPLLGDLEEIDRSKILHAGQAALGCLGYQGPIHTTWSQEPTGRIYASKAAVLNIPKLLRPALEPVNGGMLCEIDFKNYEPRLMFAKADTEAPAADIAEFIGNAIEVPRNDVKEVFNPLLHGQTRGNLVGTKQWEKLENRKKLDAFLQEHYPSVWEESQIVKKDKALLQRLGAEVFFPCFERALMEEDLPAGLPTHDGWTFPAKDEAQRIRVKDIFEETASEIVGQPMPVSHRILS